MMHTYCVWIWLFLNIIALGANNAADADCIHFPGSGFIRGKMVYPGYSLSHDDDGRKNANEIIQMQRSDLTVRLLSRSLYYQDMCKVLEFNNLPEESKYGVHQLHSSTFRILTEVDPECQNDVVEHDWLVEEEGGSVHKSHKNAVRRRMTNGRLVYSNGKDLLSYVAPEEEGMSGTWIINRGVSPGTDSGHSYNKPTASTLSPVHGDSSWYWLVDGEWVEQPDMNVRCNYDGTTDIEKDSDILLSDGAPAGGDEQILLYKVEYFPPEGGPLQTTELALGCEGVTLLVKGIWVALHDMHLVPESSPGGNRNGWRVHDVLSAEESGRQWRLLLRNFSSPGTMEALVSSSPSPTIFDKDFVYDIVDSRKLTEVEVGYFVWAWLSGPHNGISVTTQLVLLRCISQTTTGRTIYRQWPANRVAAMRVDPLEEDLNILHTQHNMDAAVLESIKMDSKGTVIKYHVDAWEVIGSALLSHIETLLGLNELATDIDAMGTVDNNISPCFFYHSKPSVPEPIVYAAELVCLLHGLKPVVMIQYDTPTEAQYRHPLVRSLVRAILGSSKVSHKVLTYRNDKTLLLFHPDHRELALSLMPFGQAQALHPVPYPNYNGPKDQLLKDEEGQVYNSAWNGYVLGYPQHMIDAYCDDFHNDLSIEHKRRITKEANKDVHEYFGNNGISRVTGLEENRAKPFTRDEINDIFEGTFIDL
jgi:hypothetical protein